jgi:adenylate kinase family enzyme
VIGLPKTGKTTLCKKIEEHLKVVRVSMADVLKESLDRPEGKIASEACETLRSGKIPSDEVCL